MLSDYVMMLKIPLQVFQQIFEFLLDKEDEEATWTELMSYFNVVLPDNVVCRIAILSRIMFNHVVGFDNLPKVEAAWVPLEVRIIDSSIQKRFLEFIEKDGVIHASQFHNGLIGENTNKKWQLTLRIEESGKLGGLFEVVDLESSDIVLETIEDDWYTDTDGATIIDIDR